MLGENPMCMGRGSRRLGDNLRFEWGERNRDSAPLHPSRWRV